MTKILSSEFDCMVLFGTPKTSVEIIRLIQENRIVQPVYCDISVLGENQTKYFNPEDYEGVYLINPGFLTNKPGKVFSKKFVDAYGWKPGAVAAFTYDAVNIILKAIEKPGSERTQIKEFLQLTDFEGVTGHIFFDKFGNRLGTKGFILIKDGTIKPVEK
jgi:ABC-type branched-subunit amino acid transport system substrate-binding protein